MILVFLDPQAEMNRVHMRTRADPHPPQPTHRDLDMSTRRVQEDLCDLGQGMVVERGEDDPPDRRPLRVHMRLLDEMGQPLGLAAAQLEEMRTGVQVLVQLAGMIGIALERKPPPAARQQGEFMLLRMRGEIEMQNVRFKFDSHR